MNKTLFAILLIALVGLTSTQEVQIDFGKCLAAAGTFAHDIKLVVDETKAEKISVQHLLISTYSAFESFNPLLHACNIDIKLINMIDSFTFENTDDCFSMFLLLISQIIYDFINLKLMHNYLKETYESNIYFLHIID